MIKLQITQNINSWNGTILSRHGGPIHSSWWIQDRNANFCLQATDIQVSSLDKSKIDVLVFIRIKHTSNKEHKEDFLKYIGGQSHIHCNDHNVPLITSYDKDMKCCCHISSLDIENFNEMRCNRRVQYCCPVLGCKSGVCKHCFSQMDENEYTYIQNNFSFGQSLYSHNNEEYDSNSATNSEGVNETELERVICENEEVSIYSISDNEENCSVDEQDEFNGMTTDIPFEEIEDDQFKTSTNPSYFVDMDEIPTTDEIPSTNHGEIPFEVEDEEEDYNYKNMRVNGHVILNQACTLLSRQDKSIRGFLAQKHFLERIVATSSMTSIPLLYPEAMLFPSIFYSMIPEDGSIVGAMPSCLLAHARS